MPLNLTGPQTQQIVNELFLLKSPAPATLPVPANTTGANDLSAKLDPIAANDRFKDLGIGVVDFTASMSSPKVWLHNAGVPWRLGSAIKISILLAAVQLRDDVRKVKALGIISSADDFDELFSIIWKQSSDSKILEIAEPGSSPRISTMFDLSKTPPDFIGADLTVDKAQLKADGKRTWSNISALTIWERLFMVGGRSDNLVTTASVSEIGVAYIKAVQRRYGLFQPAKGMHLLLAGFGTPNVKALVLTGKTLKFRPQRNKETNKVTDIFEGSNRSTQPGSAAALTAFMIGLMQNKLPDANGCNTMRFHLADETLPTTASLILEGVESVATVTKAHTKLGILGSLRCEFAYIEADGKKFAVLGTGILPKRVGANRFSEKTQGRDLGKEIFQAL